MNAAAKDPIQEQLKRQEARIVALQSELSAALQEVSWAKLKIQSLEEKLRQQLIARFGPRSENLSDLQLLLLGEEPSVTLDEVSAEAGREPLPAESRAAARPAELASRIRDGSRYPAHLPRKEEVIPCAPEACQCPSCGETTAVIGYDESERLDVEPARYFVQVTKREKRACRSCAERSVVAAPLPERIIEKGLVSDRVVVDTIVKKYCDHRVPRTH